MVETLQILGVICLISVVQSIFGVGLLLFGTPILLLMGVEYEQALAYLLPSSILINGLQIYSATDARFKLVPYFCIYGLPFVGMGAFLYFNKLLEINMGKLIGFLLLASVCIRLSNRVTNLIGAVMSKHEKPFIVAISLLHGYSNMGGTLLAMWAAFRGNPKSVVRNEIAQGYIVFALTQLALLILLGSYEITYMSLLVPIISVLTYLIIGRFTFNKIGPIYYNALLTLFMALIGLLLLFKAYLN